MHFMFSCIFSIIVICKLQVYLDSESSSVYGLMVTGMEVTDTRDQSEPILVNGSDFVMLTIILDEDKHIY